MYLDFALDNFGYRPYHHGKGGQALIIILFFYPSFKGVVFFFDPVFVVLVYLMKSR